MPSGVAAKYQQSKSTEIGISVEKFVDDVDLDTHDIVRAAAISQLSHVRLRLRQLV
eukprot:SAG31_NODE_26626_length_439_cov_0.902941_1_plen_56_part_00